MDKLERDAFDVASDKNSSLTFFRCKDNKVVTVGPTFVEKIPLRKAHCYVKSQIGRAEVDQPQSIFLYNECMGGVHCLDQNISSYMIGHRSRKWWWPVFRFCLDLLVNNVYQLYRHKKRSEGERKLDLLGFRQSIVDTYYRCLRKWTTANIFPPARKLSKVSDQVGYDAINHWIGKGKQQRCSSCQKTTLSFFENCNVGLHPDCHKKFYIKKWLNRYFSFMVLDFECIIVCTLV